MKINLIEFFLETVGKYPNKTAVVDGEREISFLGLSNRAKSLSTKICREFGFVNKPIAVFMPKCIETVIADLAITMSGNPYMNLDVKTPEGRISNILELIKPGLIITDEVNAKALPSDNDIPVVVITEELLNQEPDDNMIRAAISGIIDTDPYCLINTSGSTGTPKGVVLNHRGFFDFLYRSDEAFNFGEEVMGSLSPVVFDIYVYELIMMMSKATTLVLLPAQLSAFPAALLKIMREKKVTFIFWVPTIMVNIANMKLLEKENLPDLKLVWFAGEVFPTKQFNVWRKALPNTKFANLYGPIETTVDSIFYIIKRDIPDTDPLPIGYAYKNTDILLLDDKNQKVNEPNVEGEICVRGSSLAMGYYNNPEKTAAAFVQNPLNTSYPELIYRTGDIAAINELGEIVFKGRKDSLIKHQGYRIELGEVEHVVVNTLHMVKNGCVVYNFAKKEITLFYENEEEITPSAFRTGLTHDLPRYMIPTKFVKVDQLRRNTNGKIDRLYYKTLVNE